MTTQEFLSDLYSKHGLVHKNINIRQSYLPTPISNASTTLTPQSSNPDKSVGSYKAPIQIIHFNTPSAPPRFRERNQMNPLLQTETNIQQQKFANPDPRMNVTGTHVTYEDRLQNMDIQSGSFNYNAIIGIVGILLGVGIIVWLARGRKTG
jgi:hypothetical protein